MKTVLLIFGGLLIVGIAVLGYRKMTAVDYTVFNKDVWIAQAAVKPSENRRSSMVGDLSSRLKPGMSEDEVVDMMGAPESRSSGRFVYSLGMPGFGVDYETFVVEFDPAGKLTRFFTSQG